MFDDHTMRLTYKSYRPNPTLCVHWWGYREGEIERGLERVIRKAIEVGSAKVALESGKEKREMSVNTQYNWMASGRGDSEIVSHLQRLGNGGERLQSGSETI